MPSQKTTLGLSKRWLFVIALSTGAVIGMLAIAPVVSYARQLVQTRDIADSAVVNSKLANDAVTAEKIQNGAVMLSSTERAGSRTTLAPNEFGTAEATCNVDETLTGGGFVARGIHVLVTSFVIRDGVTYWVVQGTNISERDAELGALAICSKVVS